MRLSHPAISGPSPGPTSIAPLLMKAPPVSGACGGWGSGGGGGGAGRQPAARRRPPAPLLAHLAPRQAQVLEPHEHAGAIGAVVAIQDAPWWGGGGRQRALHG